jgi:hypothetical protein
MQGKLSFHQFYSPLNGRAKPHELPDENFLPKLNELRDDELIVLTTRQLAGLSTISLGSMSFRMSADGLKPALPRSNVFVVGDVKKFCWRNALETALKLQRAAAVLGSPRLSPPRRELRKTSTPRNQNVAKQPQNPSANH